jgi:hypothetical protein
MCWILKFFWIYGKRSLLQLLRTLRVTETSTTVDTSTDTATAIDIATDSKTATATAT